jgi:hypothetical protein
MATETIYSNATNVLSWSPTSVDKSETNNETTLVTNSSGAIVYWTQTGSPGGSIANTGTLSCVQGPSNLKWNFSESNAAGATVRITLTVSGGGTSPGAKAQGQGPGQGNGKP